MPEKQKSANAANKPQGLIGKIAERFGVDPKKFWDTLKATAFKQRDGEPPTNEQMMSLLIVADQYGLNPFTKEIYAYPDKQNGIIPVVGVDGWARIINNHPQYDGMEFRFSETMMVMPNAKSCPEWCECLMYRKDRTRPTIIPEYLDEVFRNLNYSTPWKTHTKRMLRHKAMIQTARLAFGYAGIYDEDEAQRIVESQSTKTANKSIEFDSNPVALPAPQQQPELMYDLAQADFNALKDGSYELIEAQADALQDDSVISTSFGMIASKDIKMISKMVAFTIDTNAWETTRNSFEERYKDSTLDFALSEINAAFNREAAKKE